ncbi:MBL fold metallo-hydrolase [Ornithinibacillus scapharcae]|uniref:MBL fold metallo-hydrolase n=1 Tax=Ornithinibacillus scapharcae TaxID=1147159 RepID=UPI000225B0F7|nr:MBL fold metallo-hydrolase [Ornithinibacillus scapharcae]
MILKSFSLGPLGTNCYIVYHDKEALIIDPGAEGEKLVDWLTKQELEPLAILLTHAHFDHIGAVDHLRNHYAIPVYMHEAEQDWLESPTLNGSELFIGNGISTTRPDYLLEHGHSSIGTFDFEVMYTPGHSPGSISFLFRDDNLIISGDVLFNQGIGRTDLTGGDYHVLQDSIRNKLYKLPNELIVYPGHGPQTTIGVEKLHNPFVREN